MIRRFTRFGQKQPKIWILGWIAWFITLWILSSGTQGPKEMPKIPHLDKIAHFGFFFGGGGLLCAWLRHGRPALSARQCVWVTTLIGALVGVIDEYHQSFTPGRHGNDVGDWLADLAGSFTGAVVMIAVLKYTSTWSKKQQENDHTPKVQV